MQMVDTPKTSKQSVANLILGKMSKIGAAGNQMSDFKAEMHQIRFPLQLRPKTLLGWLGI